MTEVTDPKLLAQLNNEVTDPEILSQLDGPVDYEASQSLANAPSSAANYLGDIWNAVSNPIDTLSGVGLAASGGISNLLKKGDEIEREYLPQSYFDSPLYESFRKANNILNETPATSLLFPSYMGPKGEGNIYATEQVGDDVAGFFGDRLGSVDAIKRTAMQDPVGLLGDLSMVGGLLPKVSKLGSAIEPINAAVNTTKYAAGLLTPKGLPSSLYQGAAKFPNGVNAVDPARLAETALKYDLKPTAAGIGHLELLKSDLNNRINELIEAADATGAKIPKSAVFKNLGELRKDLAGKKLSGAKSGDIIDSIAKQFDEHMKSLDSDYLTPSELQDFKTDIYKEVSFGKKNLKGTRAGEKAKKAISKAAKELIEKQDPRIKGLNKELGGLLELEQPLTQAARRIDKRNPLSIDTGINVAAGGAGFGSPGALAGGGVSLLSYPKPQANLALSLNRWKKAGASGLLDSIPSITGLNQLLFQSGREEGRVSP